MSAVLFLWSARITVVAMVPATQYVTRWSAAVPSQPTPGHNNHVLLARPVDAPVVQIESQEEQAERQVEERQWHNGGLENVGHPEAEQGQEQMQSQEELDRLYEERMEDEYAKREGGA